MIHTTRWAACIGVVAFGLLAASAASARSDADFMKQAAQNGAAEIEASKLALQKAQRPEVKTFAEKMVADHTKTADELKQLAASKKVSLPDGPSVKQKAELKMISAGDDAKFDERYAKSFGVKAHEETIKLFQEAANGATDAEVKAFAQKTLPALNHHLEMAKSLESSTARK
jgi:putative membrane protein